MNKIGDRVHFGKRWGIVVGHTAFARRSHSEEVNTYLIVELDRESASYLMPRDGDSGANPDCFISLMLINPKNVDESY